MSGTAGPDIAITMGAAEWGVFQLAIRKAPLPFEITYPVVARFENQLQAAMARLRSNGQHMPEAEDQP